MKQIFIFILLIYSIESLAQSNNKKANQNFELAIKQYQAENFDESISLAQKTLKIDNNFIDAYLLLATIADIQHEYKKEIDYYYQALKINQNQEEIIFALADTYLKDYNNDSAIFYYKQLLSKERITEKTRNEVKHNLEIAEFRKYQLDHPQEISPKNLGENINTIYNDYFPSISANGNTLAYTIELPQTAYNPLLPKTQEDIYISYRKDNKSNWQQAKSIGAIINTSNNEGAPFLTADGQKLLFTSCTCDDGMIKCCDIYYSQLYNSEWGFPKKLASPINTQYWESQPCLSADNKTLYFVSNRPGGYGKKDIWYSTLNENGYWNQPINCGPNINSPGDDCAPFIHADNQTLYFSTDYRVGMGGQDIFVSHKNGDEWSEPQNLGYPINTKYDEMRLAISVLGNSAILATNRIEGNKLDLFEISIPQHIRPTRTIFVEGTVYDEENMQPLVSQFQVVELSTGKTIISSSTEPRYLNILLYLPEQKQYALNVSAQDYMMESYNFSLCDLDPNIEKIELDIPLKKISTGNTFVLNNTFFATDSFSIKEESYFELNKLIKFLADNKTTKIEIGGHTDNTGSESHNKELSNNRAKSITQYLISQGIEPNRITYTGYGSTKPIANNDTEQNKAKNRRVEVKIIE
ncbi:MAG: OmpA family protein [Bacteroidales bacterium]|nr:OmpA family protein [Bacteroidales bacterium]